MPATLLHGDCLDAMTTMDAGRHAMSHATPAVEGREFAWADRVEFKDDDGQPVQGVVWNVCESVCIRFGDLEWGTQWAYRRPCDIRLIEAASGDMGHYDGGRA